VGGERVIAEAILHERSHLHVHRLLNVVKLHTLDHGEQFYSPWRSDPRPLNGLLHGLHVLARLCDFFHAALESRIYSDDADVRGHFEERLSWCQVAASVGLLQVPLGALTTEGRILVTDVRRAAEFDGRDPNAMTVESVLAHVELWRNQHEELSAQVKVPQWLRRSLLGRP
jgi:HEXXH motif-containing protein